MNRLPLWFRQDIPDSKTLNMLRLLCEFNINTVCQEAKCPNITHCFRNNQLTFMILGNVCTRNCAFCNINNLNADFRKSNADLRRLSNNKSAYICVPRPSLILRRDPAIKLRAGRDNLRPSALKYALPIDKEEPYRIKELVKILGLNFVVITSVSRDDLPDGGASQFSKTIELIRGINKDIKIEVLIPDFQGKISSLKCVLDAGPDIVGHNIETVRRLYSDLRPMADYQLSLGLLRSVKELRPKITTKSSLMLGLGETETEVFAAMEDLIRSYCDILTLGQYLAPSPQHYPVKEFVSLEQFDKYREMGLALGFKSVFSGPKVRSSYRAEELYEELLYV